MDAPDGYDPSKRLPPNICPERYCFFWIPHGGSADMSGQIQSSVDAAFREGGFASFPEGGCSCTFGICMRLPGAKGERDWYEPCEPELDADGLPHVYFMPDAKDA
jgi:hypothetical protein